MNVGMNYLFYRHFRNKEECRIISINHDSLLMMKSSKKIGFQVEARVLERAFAYENSEGS